MSPEARKVTGFLLLAFLALPTGLCSLAFTPMASDTFLANDSLARGLGQFALVCTAVGYVICGLSIWGGLRLARPTAPDRPPTDPTP